MGSCGLSPFSICWALLLLPITPVVKHNSLLTKSTGFVASPGLSQKSSWYFLLSWIIWIHFSVKLTKAKMQKLNFHSLLLLKPPNLRGSYGLSSRTKTLRKITWLFHDSHLWEDHASRHIDNRHSNSDWTLSFWHINALWGNISRTQDEFYYANREWRFAKHLFFWRRAAERTHA